MRLAKIAASVAAGGLIGGLIGGLLATPAVAQTPVARAPAALPAGFALKVGDPRAVTETTEGAERIISIRSQATGGIVRYPVDLPLEAGTRLKWDWRVNALPSDTPETTQATHDYTSIAVEFDDGRDLSWYWSAAEPEGRHFVCPLPDWKTETHLVLRTGAKALGTWLSEDRDIAADARKALPTPPRRIVAIWLIHYTVPQKRLASTDLRRIRVVRADGREEAVFPR